MIKLTADGRALFINPFDVSAVEDSSSGTKIYFRTAICGGGSHGVGVDGTPERVAALIEGATREEIGLDPERPTDA